jgi:adenylate cyclase
MALKALALDDSNVDALLSLSYIDFNQRRFDQAVAEAERAVATNPNYAMGYSTLSDALNASGKGEDALRAAEKAMRLDPASEDFYAYAVGDALVESGRYEEGVTVLKRHLASYPDNLVAHLFLVVAYTELGREHEARAEATEVMRISPRFEVAPPENAPFGGDIAWNRRWIGDLHKAGLK